MEEAPCDSQAGGVGAAGEIWRVGYTKPRHEARVGDYWRGCGYTVFLPCYSSWRRWSDRKRLVQLPLFPSYVFVRLSADQYPRSVRAPGLLWFLSDRSGWLRVDPSELAAVRKLLASGMAFDPLPTVSEGAEVEIVMGSLRGCRGVLQSKADGYVVLQVSAIQAGIRVRLPDPSWIEPCRPRQRPISLGVPAHAL